MAVRHGYTIVPVATVGTEDVVRPVMDVPIREVLTAGGKLGSISMRMKRSRSSRPSNSSVSWAKDIEATGK